MGSGEDEGWGQWWNCLLTVYLCKMHFSPLLSLGVNCCSVSLTSPVVEHVLMCSLSCPAAHKYAGGWCCCHFGRQERDDRNAIFGMINNSTQARFCEKWMFDFGFGSVAQCAHILFWGRQCRGIQSWLGRVLEKCQISRTRMSMVTHLLLCASMFTIPNRS